jgi:hypothetical protein
MQSHSVIIYVNDTVKDHKCTQCYDVFLSIIKLETASALSVILSLSMTKLKTINALSVIMSFHQWQS